MLAIQILWEQCSDLEQKQLVCLDESFNGAD